VISRDLATRLRDAGLRWRPVSGDRFFIPDRNLDDEVFSISEMTVDVRPVAGGGQVIAFNGSVEWALDAIQQREVVWLPSEAQLRERLGQAFRMLERIPGGYRCEVRSGGERRIFTDADPAECYGRALLDELERRHATAGAGGD
jgi:hypothetical protein